jgi:hypothetical protein
VFSQFTDVSPQWCPSQYQVRSSALGNVWSNWSNETGLPTGDLIGAPAFELSWAAQLTDSQRSNLQWRRRLTGTTNTATATMEVLSVTEFRDIGPSPCGGGGGGDGGNPNPNPCPPGSSAATPEFLLFQSFAGTNANYWARATQYRAAFADAPGCWSAWSGLVVSDFTERGITPLLRVSNSGQRPVVFQRRMSPLPGQTGEIIENTSDVERVGETNTFEVRQLPPYRYVTVTAGGTVIGGVPQGNRFLINYNNEYNIQVSVPPGVWGLENLLVAISAAFDALAGGRVGLVFTPVEGTICLRASIVPPTEYRFGDVTAPFRVLPYEGSGGGERYWPSAANGALTLNRLLGFGPIANPQLGTPTSLPSGSPQVSALEGQVGYWGVVFNGR